MANKKLRKINGQDLVAVMEGTRKVLFMGAEDKQEYKDGKPTGNFGSTVLNVTSKEFGTLGLVFPYRQGLAEKCEEEMEFGELVSVPDLGQVIDVAISIYNDALSLKIQMEEKS